MDANFPLGWLCLLPPLLTIVLAVLTRRVVLSLLLGIIVAVAIVQPAAEVWSLGYFWSTFLNILGSLTEEHLWRSIVDEDHLRVFAFTSLLGMQVALIHRAGGMQGIVAWAMPWVRSRRGGQVMTWFLGLLIFIDDYANTLLLGSTMRPLTDRLKISREKLAFLVDSTAAPVSGLALVSTWVATEISTMQLGYTNAGIDIRQDAFGIFVQTIPSRFYVLYMLLFVLLCGWLCRDFGPMLTAERRAQFDQPEPPCGSATSSSHQPKPRALNAILPITVTVLVAVGLLILTGLQQLAPGQIVEPTLKDWGQLIGQGSSNIGLLYGALAGLLTIVLLGRGQRSLSVDEIKSGMTEGFLHVVPAMVILWLAWTLSKLTGGDYLQTGDFVASQLSQVNLAAGWLPTLVFLLASGTAFATGTSWGTMGILLPLIVPLVHDLLEQQLGSAPPPDHFVLVASIGSVLAGAIFGDHCSPISDTTILSSRSSSCDHIAHVRTQMPYALTVGGVAIVIGTIPAGFGFSSWIILPIGAATLVFILIAFGKPASSS